MDRQPAARVYAYLTSRIVAADQTFSDAVLDARGPARGLPRPRHPKLCPDGDAGEACTVCNSKFEFGRSYKNPVHQVLSGILPISRVSAIPLCIYHAARLIPLEKVLGLAHPSLASPAPEDKRTWRDGMRPATSGAGDTGEGQPKEVVWTAMDILTAYATKKGWVTAKAGRPDVNRAGNASTCTISITLHRRRPRIAHSLAVRSPSFLSFTTRSHPDLAIAPQGPLAPDFRADHLSSIVTHLRL